MVDGLDAAVLEIEIPGIIQREAHGILQLVLHQGGVYGGDDGGGRGGEGDGDGQAQADHQNLFCTPGLVAASRGLQPAGAPKLPGHIQQGGQLGDGDTGDGAGCGSGLVPADMDQPHGQGQAEDQLEQGLDDLRDRGGGHVGVALGIAPEGGKACHQSHRGGQHPHGGGGLRVAHEGGKAVRSQEHGQGAEGAEGHKETEGDTENLVHLVLPALGVGLGDHLAHGHGDARRGDHEQNVENVEGVGEIRVAAAQNVDEGHLVHGADDLHQHNAHCQNGSAAKKGVLLLSV